jgi:hypothetical protein
LWEQQLFLISADPYFSPSGGAAVEKIRLSQQTMDIQKISNAQKKTISFYFLSYTRENKKVSR